MAINKDIGSQISEMAQSVELSPAPVFDTDLAAQQEAEAPMQMGLEFPEYEQTAGLFPKLFKKGAQTVEGLTVKEALKPLTEKKFVLSKSLRLSLIHRQ